MNNSSNSSRLSTELQKQFTYFTEQTCRLINSSGTHKDFDGLVIDRIENYALIHAYAQRWIEVKEIIATALKSFGISHVVLWARDIDPKETTKKGAEIILGEPESSIVVKVDGISLLLKPFKTSSGGIFLDTRDIRRELIAQSSSRRVLNLFCFTGSLGIAAALGGASEVTQVDISQSVIEWAKENATLNAIPSTVIKYFTDDALDVLGRCARRREKGTDQHGFDTIIIDPPAFGTTGSKRFNLSESIRTLMDLALVALAEHGTIYLMCNETKILPQTLEKMAPRGMRIRHLRAPHDTHPGNLNELSMMRGIAISK